MLAKENNLSFDISQNKIDTLSSEAVSRVVGGISPYTSNIDEDVEDLKLSLELDRNGQFLNKPIVLETQTSQNNPAVNNPQNYIVQTDDTLNGIAYKFNLKPASIRYINDLQVDTLKPGQAISIPNADVPDSVLIAVEKAKQKKLAQEKLAAQLAQQQKNNRQLALRNATSIERASGGYSGDISGIIVPINHNGISRGVSRGHTGIDYRANIGTPVVAAASGRVVEITRGWSGGYGLSIVIDHGGGKTSRYAHLSGFAVSTSNVVSQGEVIGYSGSTGWSTGPHLHFEFRINGSPINPF